MPYSNRSEQPLHMKTHAKHSGFTLIEVMVALFVLALGLLGLAMLQTTSLKLNTNSYSRTQASFLAYDILDRIRANPTAFKNDQYTVADKAAVTSLQTSYNTCKTSSCNCESAATSCDATNLALFDLGRWYAQQYDATNPSATLLPGAAEAFAANTPSTITKNGDVVTVTLRWTEQNDEGVQELKTQSWQAEIPSS